MDVRTLFQPIRIRITRNGGDFIGEMLDKRGHWTEIGSANIAMPEKVMVGFCGSDATGTLRGPSLMVDGKTATGAFTEQRQISRPSTAGALRGSAENPQLTG